MPTANELYQQAKVSGNVSFQAEWGRTQQQLAKLSQGERVSQLGFSSLEPGEYVMAYDAQGQARMRIGHQSDGTVGVIYGNGKPPPVPSAPSVGARQLGVFVGWDGLFADSYAKPGDFARIDVHMSEEQGFLPDGTTIVGTIAQEGGILVGADSVTHYIKLVAVNSSDVPSAPTVEVAVLPLPAGQIAAGAIGAQQLAVDMAMISRVIVGNPSASRLELDGRVGVIPGLRLYDVTGQQTLGLDATTGDVSIRGSLRSADSGERLVVREENIRNDIRFYPATGTNWARIYARTFTEAGQDYGAALVQSSIYNDRRSFMWTIHNQASLYRGTPDGLNDYGGLFVNDSRVWLYYRTTSSATGTLPNAGVLLNSGAAELGFGAGRAIGLDSGGLYATHTNKLAVWTLGGVTWRFNYANESGIGEVPLFWVQPQNCGFQLRTTGIDVYNPVSGNYLAVAASGFPTKSAIETKTAIEEMPFDPEQVIVDAPAKMWEYKDEQKDDRGRNRKARKRFGPMAGDLPTVMQVQVGINEKVAGTDMVTQIAVVWAATGQQTARLDDLTARLAALEGAS